MTENGTLDDLYFEWLYKKIGSVRNRNPARSHWNLAKQLYRKQFAWFVPNDDNRECEGKDLRHEFIDEQDIEDVEIFWLQLDCSMLEMLIALARRAAYESYGDAREWFWKFMENLGLNQYTDEFYNDEAALDIEVALDRVINRTYERNGDGGLFPLKNAKKDQRKVELWYQLATYLLEGGYVDHGP